MFDINFKSLFNFSNSNFSLVQEARHTLPDDLQVIADRIRLLIKAHCQTPSYFLRIAPAEWNWSLGNFVNDIQLVNSLTPSHIKWLAETFQIEQSWLEGASSHPNKFVWGYKHLDDLVRALTQNGWTNRNPRMTILAEEYDGKWRDLEQYVIVLSDQIVEDNDTDDLVYRHVQCDTVWTWNEWPCRRDTKVLARWFSMSGGRRFLRIPIVPITHKEMDRIRSRNVLLAEFVPDSVAGYDCLENRVLRHLKEPRGESCLAIETEELPSVLSYAQQLGISL